MSNAQEYPMHTNLITLTMPEGLSSQNARYQLLIDAADAIYGQETLEQCFASRHDIHNNAYSAACEGFILGWLGFSLGSLLNQQALSPRVKEILSDELFRIRLMENANLLLQALKETEGEYMPVLVTGDNIAAMTKNAFANDISIHIDGKEGIRYSPAAETAFRRLAEFWGGYFSEAPSSKPRNTNDNGYNPFDDFVEILEGNLREMGLMNIRNTMHPHGALTTAMRAASIYLPREAYPQYSEARIDDLRTLHYQFGEKSGEVVIA
jgi:hypothetical protein